MVDEATTKFLDQLYQIEALKFGEFTLASGAKSSFYIDLRFLPSFPEIFSDIIDQMASQLNKMHFDAIIGIPLAGIPFATALSLRFQKPMHLMRKNPKKHGLQKLIEGPSIEGKEILLVDDLISSGHSKEFAIQAIKNEGGKVSNLAVLIDRGGQSIDDWAKNWTISINALHTVSLELLEAYQSKI